MGSSKNVRVYIIGLALFAMFFGSGNLIFPLSVGQLAQNQYGYGMLGFLLTGVLVPFLGVVTMVLFEGDYTKFFGCLGKKLGFLFTFILLTVWIPLGSGPRCITLCYANVKPYLSEPTLWVFSLVYCVLLFLVTYKKNRAFDLLGYVLTPILLTCLGITIFRGVALSPGFPPAELGPLAVMKDGMLEGYNTMDLIASFFFSSTIIGVLKQTIAEDSRSRSCPLSMALKACFIGILILGSVYIGLIGVAAANASILQGVPKDELLAFLAKTLLGARLRAVATLAIALACMTTSIALVIVYADFVRHKLFSDRISYIQAVVLTIVVSFGMSIFGFQGITNLTQPILAVFYPFLIFLMAVNIAWKWRQGRRETVPVAIAVEGDAA